MTRRPPPLNALQAFEAAARHSSFAKASIELNITRSAVSHRIKVVENHFGAKVFDRSSKMIELTSAGAAYLAVARKALSALDQLAEQWTVSRKRPVRISAPPTFARMILMPRLLSYLALSPLAEVAVELSMSQLDFRTSEADLYIRFGVGCYVDMECQLLHQEPVVAVASPDFIAAQRIHRLGDLAQPHLLRSRLEPWRPWLMTAGLDWSEPKVGHRFEDLALLYEAAAGGLGVALARQSLAAPLIRTGALQPLFGIEAVPEHAYYLVHSRHALQRPEVSRLVDWLLRGETNA